ncbi:hypothetical protein AB0K21_17030 [Streptosporangium sp. NPDC049248]|uniref:hypothetical protein n=1 Tax=Streptosporangium sp. NPDC049248 TaxID=3155651 RepID=UPI00341DF0DE
MRKSRAGSFVARTPLSLVAAIALPLALGAPGVPTSGAVTGATVAWRADSLTITVPASANLGSGAAGDTISASLGTVTVVDTRGGMPPWTATVSATNFTTGGGSPAQTITKANISYWSGTVTDSSGGGNRTPGQTTAAQAVPLSTSVTAFSGRKPLSLPTSTSWAPTLVVTVSAAAATGVYSGVITHSVA